MNIGAKLSSDSRAAALGLGEGVVGLRTMRTIDAQLRPKVMLSKADFTERVNRLEGLISGLRQMNVVTQQQSLGIKSSTDAWQAMGRYLGKAANKAKVPLATFGPDPAGHTTIASTPVPFISQYSALVPRAGDSACYRACRTMLAAIGKYAKPSTAEALQIAANETYSGRIGDVIEPNLKQGISDLINVIKSGGAVIAGVAHRAGSPNKNNITDHYVVLHTAKKDASGNVYFLGNDPSTRNPSKGANQVYYPDERGNLVKAGSDYGKVADRRQELAELIFPS
jgi:hypothetical protein